MADANLKLQEFGAALAGNLPQFRQQREQAGQLAFARGEAERKRESALSAERVKAMAVDNLSVLGHLKNGNTSAAISLLQDRTQKIGQLGGDASDTVGLLNKIQSGDIDGAISDSTVFNNAAVAAGVIKAPPATSRPSSRVVKGKLVTFNPDGSGLTVANIPGIVADGKAEPEVQSAKVLDDGTVVAVMKNGTRKVRGPNGEIVTGEDAATAVRTAQEFGAKIQGLRSEKRGRGGELGKSTIQQANKAFEKLPGIDKNILNIDSAIAAIDSGASTGVIQSLAPTIRTSSIELENAMNLLGLDIISAVTFGALSEGELKLALDTAVPTKLPPKELRAWLVNKKAVQTKLRDVLEDAARGLIGGKTISDVIDARIQARRLGDPGASPSAAPSAPDVDVSTMTDEQLRAIAAGGQ